MHPWAAHSTATCCSPLPDRCMPNKLKLPLLLAAALPLLPDFMASEAAAAASPFKCSMWAAEVLRLLVVVLLLLLLLCWSGGPAARSPLLPVAPEVRNAADAAAQITPRAPASTKAPGTPAAAARCGVSARPTTPPV
jgi:hypothetical protein